MSLIPTINIPSFPDVPIAPGVPTVLRQQLASAGSIANSIPNIAIGAAQQAVSGIISNVQQVGSNLINGAFGALPDALTGDSEGVQNIATQQGQWGIFNKDGTLAIMPDSIKSIEYNQTWRLPNYPMEQGAFQSYNKVQMPFDVRVSLTKGGNDADREYFLDSIELAANSINLYDVVTPDMVYKNVSIEHIDYRRTATNGVKLLTVDLSLLEIRVPSSSSSNTASLASSGQVSGGNTQAVPVTTSANLTNGQPTSSAQFESGAASAQTSVAPTDQVTSTQAAAVTSTETPVVKSTSPQFDDRPRDMNGVPVPVEGIAGNGNPTSNQPYFTKNSDGTINHFNPSGALVAVYPASYVQ
jgi:hypothetical protein